MELKQMLDVCEISIERLQADVKKFKLPNDISKAYRRSAIDSLAQAMQELDNVRESVDLIEKEKAGGKV